MQPDVKRMEGRLLSRVYEQPEGKSNLEVFRSYERELKSGGFEIHLAAEPSNATHWMVKQLYDPPNTAAFTQRPYRTAGGERRLGLVDLAQIVARADYYLVASRTGAEEEHWVVIVLSKDRPLYLIEELTTAAMETGTVTLNLEHLRSEIENAGRIAIYDIHFATGSADIEPESAEALGIIATYLSETSGSFYIVGHTDDTGSLESNLSLSEARAAAVKTALISEHAVDGGRLETRGVGPLSPVSNNTGEAGRALNRRVEIVQRLERP